MILTYLDRKIHLYFIFISIAFFILSQYLWMLLILFLYGLTLFFFRKENKDFFEDHQVTDGVIFSPVNGVVQAIGEAGEIKQFDGSPIVITIQIPWWKEWGIRMPVTSEVTETFQKNSKIEQGSLEGLFTMLLTTKGEKVGLRFLSNLVGIGPVLYTMPGDRGMRIASMGFFPFGGRVLIYLSQNYEIMVNVGDQITAGETPLAGEQT